MSTNTLLPIYINIHTYYCKRQIDKLQETIQTFEVCELNLQYPMMLVLTNTILPNIYYTNEKQQQQVINVLVTNKQLMSTTSNKDLKLYLQQLALQTVHNHT